MTATLNLHGHWRQGRRPNMASVKCCIFLILLLTGWQLGCVFGEGEDGGGEGGGEAQEEAGEGGGGAAAGRRECKTEESKHQVLLMVKPSKSKYPTQIRCSGSLIERSWVLTAASCDHPDLVAVVGETPSLKKRSVYSIKKKYKYKQPGNHNILLLELQFVFLSYPTISLPKTKMCANPPVNSEADIIGWKEATGVQKGGPIEGDLPFAICGDIKVTDCAAADKGKKEVFCTAADGSQTCNGDVGGALIYDGLLYGIVKKRTSCSEPIQYSSICAYRKWIKETTKFKWFK